MKKQLGLKRLVSFLLCFVMVFSFVLPVYANAIDDVQRLTHEGVTYEVRTTYDALGNRVVTVSSVEGTVTVVNDGVYLHITEQNTLSRGLQEHRIRLEPYVPTDFPITARNSISRSTPFWGYMWLFNSPSPPVPTLGDGWGLWAGSFGTAVGHDGNRPAARNAANSFMREVDTIATEQFRAIATLGSGAASITAAALSSAVGFALGTIIAIISAIGCCIACAGYWYSASRARSRAHVQFTIFRNNAILA